MAQDIFWLIEKPISLIADILERHIVTAINPFSQYKYSTEQPVSKTKRSSPTVGQPLNETSHLYSKIRQLSSELLVEKQLNGQLKAQLKIYERRIKSLERMLTDTQYRSRRRH